MRTVYYGRGGLWPPCGSTLIDMAESPSTRSAAPADRQDPTLEIKKRAATSVWRLFYYSEVSSFTLFSQYVPTRTEWAIEATEVDVEKVLEVRVPVCEFGELCADAGSLGHLANAKEKGKLLHCCGGGWIETFFFCSKKNCLILKQQGKAKQSGDCRAILRTSRVNVPDCAFWSLLFVVPISQLSPKNVFLSPRTSDGVSAQQMKNPSLRGLFLINHCFVRCDLHCGNCRLCCRCLKSGNEHFYSWKITWKGRCWGSQIWQRGVAKSVNWHCKGLCCVG